MAYNHNSKLAGESLGLTSEYLTEVTNVFADAISGKKTTSVVVEEVITKIGVSEDSLQAVVSHALMFFVSDEFRMIVGALVAAKKAEKTDSGEVTEHKCEECDAEDCDLRTAPYSVIASDDAH